MLVYIFQDGHKNDEDDLGSVANDISCDGLHFHELAKKAQNVMNSAKFSLRLACSPKYMVYEGVWPSCKEDPNQFKEDLRYLFTLLERGSVKPFIAKCVDLEEVPEIQDTIELLGKKGTVVCLPTALYEKKACNVVPPEISMKTDENGFLVLRDNYTAFRAKENTSDFDYAIDAGYGATSQHGDTLSDFHQMRDKQLPFEEESSYFSSPNFASSVDPRFEYNLGGYSLDEESIDHQPTVPLVTNIIVRDNASEGVSINQTSVANNYRQRPQASFQHRGKKNMRYKSFKQYQQQRRQNPPSQHDNNEHKIHEKKEEVIISSPSDERHDARKMRREARKGRLSNSEDNSGRVVTPSQAQEATSDVNKVDADALSNRQYRATLLRQGYENQQQLLLTHHHASSWNVKGEEKDIESDSRNEVDDSDGEEGTLASNDNSSFSMIMNKWKNSDELSRQCENMLLLSKQRTMV